MVFYLLYYVTSGCQFLHHIFEIFPWVPVTSSWINVNTCLWHMFAAVCPTTFDNFTRVLTSGSRPCSHTAVKTITNLQVPIRWWPKSSPDVLITVVIRPRCQLGRGTRLPIGGFSLSSGLGYFHCISTSLVEVFQFIYHSLRAVPVCSCSLFRRTHKTYSISWEGTVPFQFKLTGSTWSVLSLLYTAVFPESYS